MTEKALGPVQQKALTLRNVLHQRRAEIQRALPRHITADKMLRLAMTACTRNPKLLDCEPASVYGAILQAAQLGLEPDLLGQAYLVPYKKQCQLIPGYQGLLSLARRSGELLKVVPRVVREGDHFVYAYGKDEILEHKPCDDSDSQLTHVYAIAWIRGCPEPQFEVMTRREVEKHRDRSATRGSGPWVTDYEAMALKTVLRKLCKFLPASVELKRAVELDERAEAGLPQDLPSIDAEYTEESEPPAPDGEGEGPPTQHAPESDAPAPDSTRTGAGSTGNPSGAGGTTVCNGCGRAHSLIEGDGGAPGIGHAPNCPERHV